MNRVAALGNLEDALARTELLLRSDPTRALASAHAILAKAPNHPVATLYLGIAQRGAGAPEAALRTLQALTAAQPQWAGAHAELGQLMSDLGQHDAAVCALRRAVELQPELAAAWRTLGDGLAAAGDPAGASAAYDGQIKAAIGASRESADAETLLLAHLKRNPTDAEAIHLLAEHAMRHGGYPYAEQLLVRCLEFSPGFSAARFNYALVLHRLNKSVLALEQLRLLLRGEPKNLSYRNLLAVVLVRIGDYQEAIDEFTALVTAFPSRPKIWMSLGHVLAAAGRQQESIAAYRKSVCLVPSFGEAYWSLANLKIFKFTAEELQIVRDQLERTDLRTEDRIHLEFALGKALEDAKEFASSFEHYVEGNRLRRETIHYSADETHALVQRSKQLFPVDFFARRARFGATDPDPIFIVGIPRSGSTLIEQILASHSAVEGTMELPNISAIVQEMSGRTSGSKVSHYPEALAELDANTCQQLGQRYLAETRILRRTGRPFFIDKMPNNFLHLGLIRLALPNARIIDARRHPMACCFSAYKQLFANAQHYTYNLEEIGRYYRDYVELMAHMDHVLPGWIHRVIYEDMIEDTETEVRRLLAFCGLPFEAACLRFHETERAVRTASAQQVRQPIFRTGLDQWRQFDAWLGPLRTSLGSVLDAYPGVPEF